MLIGYARVSTQQRQDPVHQTRALKEKGVEEANIYVDPGFTGKNRNRPHLREAMAALRAGDTLVVTKLDRLARSVLDAHNLSNEITQKHAKLQIGDTVHDPTDPMGKLMFSVLAMIAEFESDLISMRTRDGLAKAKDEKRLKGGTPKLTPAIEKALIQQYADDEITVGQLAANFGVSRATVYRALQRAGGIDAVMATAS